MEAFYVKPERRDMCYGKAFLEKLAQIAVEKDCSRFEWWCLDWNQRSIDFYRSLGAEVLDEWAVFRLSAKTLQDLASND